MWEAISLLDLRDGDRIGHGTAMGIKPSLWLGRMPDMLTVSRGEWMLGLLAAWQLLKDMPDASTIVHKLRQGLEDIAYQIFQQPLTASELQRAMALRGLNRADLMRHQTGLSDEEGEPLSALWLEEADMVKRACQDHPRETALVWTWLSDLDTLERAEELISVEACFLDSSDYLRLQQALMTHVASRGILIETLPSSNVRISQYHHIGEHHSLRWMRAPGHIEDGDPEIMSCLGSDDPGIFAGDLETEFYLLFSALRKTGLSDSESISRLSVVNERGKIYRFHHPSLA
jgi:hypothetical protein